MSIYEQPKNNQNQIKRKENGEVPLRASLMLLPSCEGTGAKTENKKRFKRNWKEGERPTALTRVLSQLGKRTTPHPFFRTKNK